MKAFQDVIKYLEEQKKLAQEEGNPVTIEKLKEILMQVLEYAADEKKTGNITMNQLEGFAGGVYYNRKLVVGRRLADYKRYQGEHYSEKKGKYVAHAPKDRRGKSGWSAAMHALRDYVPDADGYVLYFTNAVWYSAIHESWGLPIISQAIQEAIRLTEDAFGKSVTVEFTNYGYGHKRGKTGTDE